MYNEEQALRKVSNTKKKQIVLVVMGICLLLIIGLGVGLYFYIVNQPLVNLPLVSLSTTEWTSGNVILTVDNTSDKIQGYSFDGGKTFGENSTYTVTDNQEVIVQVKDINGKLSKQNIISVTNIDREVPSMIFENTTVVQMGSNFSVRTGVQITDKESGLNSDYSVTPSSIDTSIEGEYVVTYSAFDKAGNFIEKTRTIIVKDVKGRTYYRYRKGTIETTQCEPYFCNCVTSSSAQVTGTCPTGYSMNESSQCCQTCYKTCKNIVWGEWSEWQKEKVTANTTTEVETMIKED